MEGWQKFERAVHRMIEALVKSFPGAAVKLDDHIHGISGRRQIDVSLRYEIAGAPFLMIIECKDHRRPLDNKMVDAIIGKMGDVGADKAMLVSSRGFTRPAVLRAKAARVELCILGLASKHATLAAAKIPVVAKVYHVSHFMTITVNKPAMIYPVLINGIPFGQIIFDAIDGEKFRRWTPLSLMPDVEFAQNDRKFRLSNWLSLSEYFGHSNHTMVSADRKVQAFDANVWLAMDYETLYYIGEPKDIECCEHLINVTQKKHHFNLNIDEIHTFTKNLFPVEEIPPHMIGHGLHLSSIELPIENTALYEYTRR